MENPRFPRRVRNADHLRKSKAHPIENLDDGVCRAEIRIFVDPLQRRMLDRAAPIAVDLLPVIAEEADDWALAGV